LQCDLSRNAVVNDRLESQGEVGGGGWGVEKMKKKREMNRKEAPR